MSSDAILSEVEVLNGACLRLEEVAERTPLLTAALLTIAGACEVQRLCWLF